MDDCTVIVALLNVLSAEMAPKVAMAGRPHISRAMKEVAKKTSNSMSHHSIVSPARTTQALRNLSIT